MISSAAIDAIGPDGLLVNVARGQLVDEDALIDALRRGRLGAAALDVFATEPKPPSRWEGDRKSVVEGKSVSVRVDLGGRRTIKKKNKKRSITIKINE